MIARHESDLVIDTGLGNQRVGESSAVLAREQLRAQPSRAFPEAPSGDP